VGLAHCAFRLKSQEDLLDAYREFKQRGVPISFTVNHGVTRSIYFLDPDGNQLEVYVDNTPEEIAKMGNPYFGLDKLEFAPDEPSLPEYFAPFARTRETH
jgi:catechol 2,3-dioxygenase